MRFCCCFGRNSNSLECIVACLLGWPRTDTQAPPRISGSALWDLCCWCALALYPNCLPPKQTPVRARFRTTDPSSPACICSCLATPRCQTLWQAEKFPFSFSDTVVYLSNHAPNTRSVRNPRQESPSFYPTFLQTASLVSASPTLLCFFESDNFLSPSKKTLWTAMELEHRVCFPTKTIHWISCNSSFPTLATHLMMNMHTPPLGLVFHPADRLSRIRPVAVERFFISSFGRLDSLSSTRHLGHSTRTNLCMPPQNGMLWWVLLDIRHMHNVSSLCRASWSTKRALRKCRCPSGTTRSCQGVKVNIST